MATQKQIEANRRNALKSTGPRTAEGKAQSSRNRRTHGLSVQPRFPDVNDPYFVRKLRVSASSHWPRSPEEAGVLVNMALGRWLQHQEAALNAERQEACFRDCESADPAVREQALADYGVALRALLRLGARADRIENAASNAWMRILGTDPATIAEWEAEDREAREEFDADLIRRGIEEPVSPEQARQDGAAHQCFIQEAVRVHFGPGSHRVPPSWDAPKPPAETPIRGKSSDSNPI